MTREPVDIIDKVSNMSQEIGGEYELTRRGVPVIIVQFSDNKYPHSFCYMAKRDVWRGFYPYCRKGQMPASDKQTKKDFLTDDDLIDFVRNKRRKQMTYKTKDAVEILKSRYIKGDPEKLKRLKKARMVTQIEQEAGRIALVVGICLGLSVLAMIIVILMEMK